MQTHVLIVDDDPSIANLIGIYLTNEGYAVSKAGHGEEALAMLAADGTVSLVILDVMMPGIDGLDVCRRIREERTTPILMLSAKAEDMDKILGLMTGADDYMVKPFNPLELVARVKSLLRRSYRYGAETTDAPGDIVVRSLRVSKTNHTVTVDNRPVQLTSREFGILHLLAGHPGRVFSAEEIFERVWAERYYQSNNTVMVHISKLREKLEQETADKIIQTVWGVGYKIEP